MKKFILTLIIVLINISSISAQNDKNTEKPNCLKISISPPPSVTPPDEPMKF